MNILYSTTVVATGGREGRVRTEDGALDLKLAPPKEGAHGNNPEQLFAAGYAACFLSALKHVAATEGVRVPEDATVRAKVGLGKDEANTFGLAVELSVALPGIAPETARELLEKAHGVCPYSTATRGNVDVRLSVEVA